MANELSEEGKYPVFSVDDFFTDTSSGFYEFRFEENHLAYRDCLERVRTAINAGFKKIFIDNTFTLEWEMEPYFGLASEFGCHVHVITVENRHGGKNQHHISQEQIEKMAAKYKVRLF